MAMKISVLMPNDEARRFEAYCSEKGYKKSTLIVRLIKEHLDEQKFALQQELGIEPTQGQDKNSNG